MRRWYSPRGAQRGLLMAGIVALVWLSWAIGYSQGASKTPANAAPHVQVQSCLQLSVT